MISFDQQTTNFLHVGFPSPAKDHLSGDGLVQFIPRLNVVIVISMPTLFNHVNYTHKVYALFVGWVRSLASISPMANNMDSPPI